jgi:hypothetical protein
LAERLGPRQKVELLEDEADRLVAKVGKIVRGSEAISAMLRPSMKREPADGTSRQPMRFIIVDLPEPDGPMMATKSPSSISSDTPSSARTSWSPMR